ncbi:MAG: sugar phosphate isomerase/epimerase [Chloroflexi bacterium]|nr:sugar phosphate isomerase/epimerase [Chloroflexota bacterium]
MPLQLAFSAWAMRDLPIAQQIEIVRNAGYVGICLVSDARLGKLDALQIDAAERQHVRALLDSAGLALTAIAGHGNLLEPDPTARTANLDRIRAGLDLAADLAGPDGPPPLVTMGYGTPATYAVDRPALIERFSELARHAATTGGIVALEPHVGQAIDQPEKVVDLMQAVDSPNFRLNLDNSHFEVMGRAMDEYVPMLVPYAVHTDLKDQRGRSPAHEFLVPGEGDFAYGRYLRALQTAGYERYLTVEISVMVQRRAGYDPAEVAARSFRTIVHAAAEAGVPLIHAGAPVGAP